MKNRKKNPTTFYFCKYLYHNNKNQTVLWAQISQTVREIQLFLKTGPAQSSGVKLICCLEEDSLL